MQRSLATALAVLALAAAPAWAVKEWYDHYLQGQQLLRADRYADALKAFQEAQRLKPTPGLNEQTYGLQFIPYFPYHYMGVCYLRLGDFNSAIRMFNIAERQGAVVKSGLYRDLLRLRNEAEDSEKQKLTRLARDEVQRLLREAGEHSRGRRWSEALARLAQAQAAAAALDPATQRQIAETIARVRSGEREAAEAASRAQRLDQLMAEARRLLDEGRPGDALVRFEEALGIDPRDAAATEGRREAQERVLASTTRQARLAAFQQGKTLFEAGRYEEAIRPLTDGAADASNAEARQLLEKARAILGELQRQKETAERIERLAGEGERLLQQGLYPEAQVKFESVLALDAENVRARTRRDLAERRTGEAILSRWLPNRDPELTFFEPRASEIDGPTVSVIGVATDDRGLGGVEFRIGDRVVAQVAPGPALGGDEAERTLPFEREFPLAPGPNEIMVTARDAAGATRSQVFRVTRRLRFYETRAFWPASLAAALGLIGAGLAVQVARRRRALKSRFNPYIAGAPVLDEEMFFGRQKLMARILNVLHHNSLMITGERRIGKTTFLYHLKRALETDTGSEYRFFPVFVDLQGVDEQAFFHTVMADTLEALKPPPETLLSLRFGPEPYGYDGRDFSHDLQRVIEALKGRTDKRVKLALLVDEVDVLNEYSERVNQRLRSIFMKTFSEHLVAVMSGVGIKRTWTSEVSPWYNFFDEVEISGLAREEAEDLVRRPVGGIFRYQPEAVEAILAASELKPYLIQKLCIHALNRMLDERRSTVTRADVLAVRDAVLSERLVEARELPPASGPLAGTVAN